MGRRLVRFALFLVAFGLAWFFGYFADFRGELNSDHVVPYLMTQTHWLPQDFFYWATTRFGVPYVVFWKAFVRPWLGNSATLFYLAHVLIFFVSIALWTSPLRDWRLRLLFFALMAPFLPETVQYFLLPGHIYGMTFALSGLWVYLGFTRGILTEPTRRREIAGLTGALALLYWQHPLAGITLWSVSLIYLKRWEGAAFFVGWAIPIEIARFFARRWIPAEEYGFVDGTVWVENLRFFLSQGGIPFRRESFGANFIFSLLTLFAARGHLRWWIGVVVLTNILLINHSQWFTLNGRDPRYYQYLVPFFLLGVLWVAERSSRRPAWFAGLFLLLGLGFRVENASAWHSRRLIAEARALETLRGLDAAGCRAFIGDYWQSYSLYLYRPYPELFASPRGGRNPRLEDETVMEMRRCTNEPRP